MKYINLIFAALLLSSCASKKENHQNQQSIKLGQLTFDENCAACHGKEARGLVKNWKVKGADGKYPAPPLNGSAHAWHHSPLQLLKTINEGSIKMGGQMPGFAKVLTDDEKQATLDYIMSLWPSEIKTKYDEGFK